MEHHPADTPQPQDPAAAQTQPHTDPGTGFVPEETASGCPIARLLLIFALVALTAAVLVFFLRSRSAPGSDSNLAAPVATTRPLPVLPTDFHGLEFWVLDVGQGDCLFLRSPNRKTMLVDSGPAGSFGRIHLFLQRQHVTRLDVVVCSHLHVDHIGSMRELFDHYEVGVVYLPPFDIDSSVYANMLESMEEHGIAAKTVTASIAELPQWDPECQIYALAPYDVHYDDENDTSIIMRVAFSNTAVLLMGDATELSERLSIKAIPNHLFHANVLKVGHHGSDTSTSTKLIKTVKPQFAVISVGAFNDYGLPDEAVIHRLQSAGIRVLRTDLDGSVLIVLDGEQAWVVE